MTVLGLCFPPRLTGSFMEIEKSGIHYLRQEINKRGQTGICEISERQSRMTKDFCSLRLFKLQDLGILLHPLIQLGDVS